MGIIYSCQVSFQSVDVNLDFWHPGLWAPLPPPSGLANDWKAGPDRVKINFDQLCRYHHRMSFHVDGSVTCYKWWQVVLIFMVCFWIFPLPIAIYTSSKLLHNHLLSARIFLCLVFPMPVILYWFYIWVYRREKVISEITEVTELGKSAKESLEIIHGPLRRVCRVTKLITINFRGKVCL